MPRNLNEEIGRLLEAQKGEIPELKQAAQSLWAEMSDDEKIGLWKNFRTHNIIECGGLIDFELAEEEEAPDSVKEQLLDLDFWFRSAKDHADGAGEWEHEVGDLEDLVEVCAEVLGNERALAAMTAPSGPTP